ncbi:hypothetical protein [Virgibacillus senegalensis]|uniref:hypothetical protein n=1 Tax=Virgibacillus senegalensis TaxID=1499679 RepID=UPI00069E3653|nr:hypothetical protein [Virgibacillus senegalensis]
MIFTLTLTLLLAFSPFSAMAKSTSDTDKNLDVKFTGENSWEYIQEKNGKVYKVIEKVDAKSNEITSTILKQNKKGKFVLEKEYFTIPLKDGGVEVTTLINGKKTKEKIYLDDVSTEEIIIEKDKLNKSESSVKADPNDPLTSWKYSYTSRKKLNFNSLTVGIVAGVVSSFFGLPAAGSFAVSVAGMIVSESLETTWGKKVRYVKNVKGTTILAGTKDYNYVYRYNNYTGLIKSGTNVDCAQGYYCGN